jgi:hypothetical protein
MFSSNLKRASVKGDFEVNECTGDSTPTTHYERYCQLRGFH